MQYAIILHEAKTDFSAREDSASSEQYWGAHGAFYNALVEAGVFVGATGLLGPETSTTVRLQNGKRFVQDGPYADTKEQLGGLMIIEVPDLDAALNWAVKCPTAGTGVVEVRPLMPCD